MSEVIKRQRIAALDLLRGYFLAIMIIDHLVFFPSVFEFLSGRGALWASAAEGFFIISGMLVGYVFGPRMQQNAKAATAKMWRRAGVLYIWSVSLTYLFVWWGNVVGQAKVKPGLWEYPPLGEFLYKTLTLQYSYGWADFLQYYVVFILLAPLILWLCIKGRAKLVFATSFIVWALSGNNFNLSWQFIFIGGIVVGHYLPYIEQKVKGLAPAMQTIFRRSLYATAAFTILLSAVTVRGTTIYFNLLSKGRDLPGIIDVVMLEVYRFHRLTDPWVVKWTLEPLRLAIAILWFVALYIFVRRHEVLIDRVTRGFLTTLGQKSLFVYGIHAIVVFAIMIVLPKGIGFAGNSICTAIVLTGIYLTAKYFNFKLPFRRTSAGKTSKAAARQPSTLSEQIS